MVIAIYVDFGWFFAILNLKLIWSAMPYDVQTFPKKKWAFSFYGLSIKSIIECLNLDSK